MNSLVPSLYHYYLYTYLSAIGLNLYRGSRLWKYRYARGVYGGQVVAQAMTAAKKSLDKADFLFHSLHCYFVNPTKPSPDVIYEVERLKDGKSFCSRSVKAWQEGRIVFHALVSLYKAEATSANLSHSSSVMPDVPQPPDNDAENSDGRFIPFNFTGCHAYIYSPDEQRKAWKTRTPFHPRYGTVHGIYFEPAHLLDHWDLCISMYISDFCVTWRLWDPCT